MPDARKPGDVASLFVAAFNAGNLDALMQCFEPEACFVSKSGRVAAGAEAVREAYRRTLANKPYMDLEVRKVLPAGPGLALLIVPFTQKAATADGPMEWHSVAADIVRQQPDGSWRLVLDNPFGIE
jgi:uncharacterized protein (TIGR02246 family)